MPIIVPPFVQYQAPLYPLRGLWNNAPPEGDRYVSAEIDWAVTTGPGLAVQFLLSGNSPVAFSQIVAAQVDNTKNSVDAAFLFPDSAYTLLVPAYTQGVFPVFTNALMFYVSAPTAVAGDRTVFQVFNSQPPPVAVQRSTMQEIATIAGIGLGVTGLTPLIPPGVNGTIEGFSFSIDTEGVAAGAPFAQLVLVDGAGHSLWSGFAAAAMTGQTSYVGPLQVAFVNGLSLQVFTTTLTAGTAIFNVYYGLP